MIVYVVTKTIVTNQDETGATYVEKAFSKKEDAEAYATTNSVYRDTECEVHELIME